MSYTQTCKMTMGVSAVYDPFSVTVRSGLISTQPVRLSKKTVLSEIKRRHAKVQRRHARFVNRVAKQLVGEFACHTTRYSPTTLYFCTLDGAEFELYTNTLHADLEYIAGSSKKMSEDIHVTIHDVETKRMFTQTTNYKDTSFVGDFLQTVVENNLYDFASETEEEETGSQFFSDSEQDESSEEEDD